MKPRINWRRVWEEFDEYCRWMDFPSTVSNAWEYQKEKLKDLVNAELRGKAKKARAK